MHRTSFALPLLVAFAACHKSAPPRAEPAPALSLEAAETGDPRLAVVDRIRAVSDPARVASAYAEGAVVVHADGTRVQGRAAIEQAARAFAATLEAPQRAASRVWIKGDTIVSEDVVRGTARGRVVGVSSLELYWFDGSGLVKEHHTYANEGLLGAEIAGEPDVPAAPPMPTRVEVHVARDTAEEAAVAAFAGRLDDATANGGKNLGSMLDEHVVMDCNLGAHTKGRAEFLDVTNKGVYGAFPDARFTTEHVWAVEDYAVVEHTLHGTHDGTFGEAAATHKRIAWRWAEVYRVKDGKLVNEWAFSDYAAFAKQVAAR